MARSAIVWMGFDADHIAVVKFANLVKHGDQDADCICG
jgi:hypothetical protein